jgi:hypothetical protein
MPCSIRSFETRKLGDGSSPRHVIDSQGAHWWWGFQHGGEKKNRPMVGGRKGNNFPKGKQKEILGMHWIFQGIGFNNNKRTSKLTQNKVCCIQWPCH